ncbi:MAG: hypothetical protein WBB28_12365 [Crinalium sp.]
MSGFDPGTGIYGLTATKAEYWSRLDKPMSYYAKLLKDKGFEVTKVREHFLEVRATEFVVKAVLTSA